MTQITENYVATGKLVYIFYQLPLSFHQYAQITAEASECAGLQGKFWEMHDQIFLNQDKWSSGGDVGAILSSYAVTLNLDSTTFEACMSDHQTAAKIQENSTFAAGLGISGTPFFVVSQAGKLYAINGAQPYDVFQQGLDGLLQTP